MPLFLAPHLHLSASKFENVLMVLSTQLNRIFHHILKCCFLKMTGKTQILNLRSNADAQKSVIFKVNWCSEISNLSLNKAYYEESSSDTATTFSIIHVNIGIAWSLQMYRNIHLHIYVFIYVVYVYISLPIGTHLWNYTSSFYWQLFKDTKQCKSSLKKEQQ